MSDKKLQKSTKQEPQFISNSPCNEDLFEGKSHSKIANSIADLLIENKNCNIVGIDGGWGSGKSNLVKLVESNIKTKNKNFHFFVYDAWGFQNDYQKRSILETLTSYLIEEKIISGSKWNSMLMQLLSKKSSVGSKVVKELNPITKVSAIFAFLLPIFNFIYLKIPDFKFKNYLWFIPVFLFIITLVIVQACNMNKFGQKITFTSFFKDLFYSYLDYTDNTQNVEDAIKYETIYEEEASTRDFKNWMQKIDLDLNKERLVIVFDNMDRLPSEKVQELWAAINSILADIQYKSISVLVPFDRKHIRNAFKNENIDEQEKTYGDDFINKTFNVVFRVSPPTMSNWKQYFYVQWRKAFDEEPDYSITQIYDLLTKEQTPRKIIAFINEFVSLRKLFSKEMIPDQYVCLFIFAKTIIAENPDVEIITPSYLGALGYLYKNDTNLSKYMSALFYQLEPETALDIIYADKIKRALDNNNTEELENLVNLNTFEQILQKVIPNITNLPNTIYALEKCLNSNIKNQQVIWDNLVKKVTVKEKALQKYQTILLERITNKDIYIKQLINDFCNEPITDVNLYYTNLSQLNKLSFIEAKKYFVSKKVDPSNFISFVELAKEEYEIYNLECSKNEIDRYLATFNKDQLKILSAMNYLDFEKEDCLEYISNIEKNIDSSPNDKNYIPSLFERLKEIQRPVNKKISDAAIVGLFPSFNENTEFYYDLICMRIRRLTSFQSQSSNYNNSILQKNEETYIEKIAERIESYICFGDLLIHANEMKSYITYIAVCKKLLTNSYGIQSANITELLNNYEIVKTTLNVSPEVLFESFNGWEKYVNDKLNDENIIQIPLSFFEDGKAINNKLYKTCCKKVKDYLNSQTSEDWEESILNNGFNYKVILCLEYKIENCYEGFKELLVKQIDGEISSLNKQSCQKLIDLAQKNNRSLSSVFNTIRDRFCSGKVQMSLSIFDFFGKWIFEYSDLNSNKECLRTILPNTILDNESVIQTMLFYKEKVISMIKASGADGQDFKDKIQDLLNKKYFEKSEFTSFANSIGIKKTSEDSEEK